MSISKKKEARSRSSIVGTSEETKEDKRRKGDDDDDHSIECLKLKLQHRSTMLKSERDVDDSVEQNANANARDERTPKHHYHFSEHELADTDDGSLLEDDYSSYYFDEKEFDDLLSQKERGVAVDESRLYELELLYRQKIGELTEEETMDLELFRMQHAGVDTVDTILGYEHQKDYPNDDHNGSSFSEKKEIAIEEFQSELKKEGLPRAISFGLCDDHKSLGASTVTDGSDSYSKDLVHQKKGVDKRENWNEPKEDCLEEARVVEKKKSSEDEEIEFSIFGQILNKRNEKMREVDEEVDDLVEKEEVGKIIMEKSSETSEGRYIAKSSESWSPNVVVVGEKSKDEAVVDPLESNNMNEKESRHETKRGWGFGFFRRSPERPKNDDNERVLGDAAKDFNATEGTIHGQDNQRFDDGETSEEEELAVEEDKESSNISQQSIPDDTIADGESGDGYVSTNFPCEPSPLFDDSFRLRARGNPGMAKDGRVVDSCEDIPTSEGYIEMGLDGDSVDHVEEDGPNASPFEQKHIGEKNEVLQLKESFDGIQHDLCKHTIQMAGSSTTQMWQASVSEKSEFVSLEGTDLRKDEDATNVTQKDAPASFNGRTQKQQISNEILVDNKPSIDKASDDALYLELTERVKNGERLLDDEAYELELLGRIRSSDTLHDGEIEELEMLMRGQEQHVQDTVKFAPKIQQEATNDVGAQQTDEFRTGDFDEYDSYEQELLLRLSKGEILEEAEIEELRILRHMREEQGAKKGSVEVLSEESRGELLLECDHQEKKKIPTNVDDETKYIHLLDRQQMGDMNENEQFELALLERYHSGEGMDADEFEELKTLGRFTEHFENRLDEPQIQHRQQQQLDRSEDFNGTAIRANDQVSDAKNGTKLHFIETLDGIEPSFDSNPIQGKGGDVWQETSRALGDMDDPASIEKDLSEQAIDDRTTSISERIESDASTTTKEISSEQVVYGTTDSGDNNLDLSDARGIIVIDLLRELDLVSQLRKDAQLNDQQEYELDLLTRVREGELLSKKQMDDLNHIRRYRKHKIFDDGYLQDLFASGSCPESVNNHIRYEIKLSHKDLSSEILSADEEVELCLFDQRRDGHELTEDDLDELDLLKSRRTSEDDNDVCSDKNEELLSEDDDSIYRRELQESQRRGQRLGKKEFQWLQILIKKSLGEQLNEDDLDELELMRSQKSDRNDGDEEIVNTKKLLEKEVKKQRIRKIKENRRREKEERREQRKIRREQRQKVKKMRKKRTGNEGAMRPPENVTAPQPGGDERNSTETQNLENKVETTGLPSMQKEVKEEPKRGVFGGVFGNKKKQRQQQQLEEAKRMQEELIKEQMKALALNNEVEELEREKVMQEQLVRETIEKQKADGSHGSSSWETDTGCNSEESESSSWSSDSSLCSNLDDYSIGNEKEESRHHTNRIENIVDQLSIELSPPCGTRLTRTAHHSFDESNVGQVKARRKGEKSDERVYQKSRSGELKNLSKASSLELHLRKAKKRYGKRTKYGDDVSLGTLQMDNSKEYIRVSLTSKPQLEQGAKTYDRPWVLSDPAQSQTTHTSLSAGQGGNISKKEETPVTLNDSASLHFNHSFISKISECEESDEGDCVRSFASDKDDDDDDSDDSISTDDSNVHDSNENIDSSEVSPGDSLTHSLISIGDENYDLGIHEYGNIESRLEENIERKNDEFDTTWENIVADENVIAQINQRLRERQRVKESSKEKKKEEKEQSKSLQDVPRLFLFEGEKEMDTKKGKRRKKTRKRKDKSQKKMDRTLTKEFRKAMRDIFDSDSGADLIHSKSDANLTDGDAFEGDDDDAMIHSTAVRRQSIDLSLYGDDNSDALSLSDNNEHMGKPFESDDESETFDGGYLKRLKLRSMPKKEKSIYTKRNSIATGKSFQSESPDDIFVVRRQNRRPRQRRKKDGEFAGDGIDPAEIYSKELEKQSKGEHAFTVANLKKEIEDMKKTNDDFGNFDSINLPSINEGKKNKKSNKNLTLGNNVENWRQQHGFDVPSSLNRSFVTSNSDQGLLAGRGGGASNIGGLASNPHIIVEEGEYDVEGAILSSGFKSDGFRRNTHYDSAQGNRGKMLLPKLKNAGKNGFNTINTIRKTSVNSFKSFQMTFTGKKSIQSIGEDSLLNSDRNHAFEDRPGHGMGGYFGNLASMSAVGSEEPLPVPEQQRYDDIREKRNSSVFGSMNMNFGIRKNTISRWKMQGMGNSKYGSSLMMD